MICIVENCQDEVLSYKRKGSIVSIKWCKEHYSLKVSKYRRQDTYLNEGGYVVVWHDGKRVGQHRVVMEQKLGRKLVKNESVHHINGIRTDNRPENLELWLGGIRYGQRASDIICPHCQQPYSM